MKHGMSILVIAVLVAAGAACSGTGDTSPTQAEAVTSPNAEPTAVTPTRGLPSPEPILPPAPSPGPLPTVLTVDSTPTPTPTSSPAPTPTVIAVDPTPTPAPTPVPGPGTQIFFDSFEGNLGNWAFHITPPPFDSAWSLRNGMDSSYISGRGHVHAQANTPGGELTDYVVSFRLRTEQGLPYLGIRVGSGGRYIVNLGVNDLSISVHDALQPPRLLARANTRPIIPNTWQEVQVNVVGSRMQVLVDGELVLDAEDPENTFPTGGVQLNVVGNAAATGDFDDVRIVLASQSDLVAVAAVEQTATPATGPTSTNVPVATTSGAVPTWTPTPAGGGIHLTSTQTTAPTPTPVPAIDDPPGAVTVNHNKDSHDAAPGDGECADAANLCSLRAAVEEANASPGHDTIVLMLGEFRLQALESEYGPAFTGIPVTEDLTIVGRSANVLPLIDGQGQTRIFNVVGLATLRLEDVELANGSSSEGGAVAIAEGVLLATGVTFRNNQSDYGGAIHNSAGSIRIEDSSFVDNAATLSGGAIRTTAFTEVVSSSFIRNRANCGFCVGGAISNKGNGDLEITSSSFIDNAAVQGGAVANDGNPSTVTITDSLFWGNHTDIAAGAVINTRHGTMTINRTRFENNRANEGGSITNTGTMTIQDSDIVRGRAPGFGGGIANIGDLTVESSRFEGNEGQAIWNLGAWLTVKGTEFKSGDEGAGGILAHTTITTITDSLFTGNEQGFGQAINLTSGSLELTNVVISGFPRGAPCVGEDVATGTGNVSDHGGCDRWGGFTIVDQTEGQAAALAWRVTH